LVAKPLPNRRTDDDRRDHGAFEAAGEELEAGLLREMVGFAAQRLMELEVET